MKKYFLFLISFLLFHLAYSQVKKKPVPAAPKGQPFVIPKSKLFALARATKNQIMIRWAPADYGTWKACNQYGYVIEKFTVIRDNKALEKFERSLTKQVLLPKPLAQWDTLANNNDYAAVMAQALYGEDFDVTMNAGKSSAGNFINQTQTNQQRFTMAMYGADHSFTAASFAGLAYIDEEIKKGEKYFYRIYSLVPPGIRKVDTASIFIGLADYKPLPKPSDILIEFGDKTALLMWDFATYKEYYTSYIVERSADAGKTFTALSDKPYTTLTKSKTGSPGSISYLDSLPNNDTIYQYRIAGVSLFGDNGPYSSIIQGKGKTMINTTPGIRGVTLNDKKEFFLNWEMEDSLNYLIKEFRINQSETIDGKYIAFKKNIPVTVRTMKVDSLFSTNYFTVTAVTKEGQEKTSFPYLLQPPDSIAPATPTGLAATIDSLGVVRLTWNRNKEKDLDGYRIFKTNVKGQEWLPLQDSLIYTTHIIDSANLKSLNSKIYYTIKAVDRRYNQSDYAPLLEVIKPDIIPPSPPVLGDYEVSDDGIKLMWENSSDEDVVMHNLYRKNLKGAGEWKLIQSIRDPLVKQLTDKTCQQNTVYSYTLIAVDSARHESEPAIPITVQFGEKRIRVGVKTLQLEADRDARQIVVSWVLMPGIKNVKKIEVYRAAEKAGMSLYKVLDKNSLSFTDTELQVNTKYKYGVRLVFDNGQFSDFITKNVTY